MNPTAEASRDRFFEAVRRLGVLDDDEVRDVVARAEREGEPLLAALTRSGRASGVELELLGLLLGGDDAVPGYELLGLIGRGGMGAVWRARQKSLNRIVALKTVLMSLASDRTGLARFEQEAVAIARLAHPNIVTALDLSRQGDRLFLAMEFVDGEDLARLSERSGPLSETVAWAIGRQVAAGLWQASRQGVIHRDIKPANILAVAPPDGYPLPPGVPLAKITDFGLSLLQSQGVAEVRLTTTGSAVGSPHYMAPEQLSNDPPSPATDVYGLGATVFHLLVGQAPWSGKSIQQIVKGKVQGPVPDVRTLRPELSQECSALLQRMMAIDSQLRPPDCGKLIEEIDRLAKSDAGPASIRLESSEFQAAEKSTAGLAETRPLSGSVTRRLRRPRRWPVALGVLLPVLGVVVAIALRGKTPEPLALVHTGQQMILFDGNNLLGDVSQTGGWGVDGGSLVCQSSPRASLMYELPEWDYWAFRMNVEVPPDALLDLAFGGSDSDLANSHYILRITGDKGQVGKRVGRKGEFKPETETIALDPARPEHYVEVEQNDRTWLLRLDSTQDVAWKLPALSTVVTRRVQLEVVNGPAPGSGEERGVQVRLSELEALELGPAHEDAATPGH